MSTQSFRDLLEKTDDKLSICADLETLRKYGGNVQDIIECLTDEEKVRVFDYPHFQNLGPKMKGQIIDSVSDEKIRFRMINNDKFMNNIPNYKLLDIVEGLSDDSKQKLLRDQNFIEKRNISVYDLQKIISSLQDEEKTKILKDKELIIDKLKFSEWDIADSTESLLNEDAKKQIMNIYELENMYKIKIIKGFSDEGKLEILLNDINFEGYEKIQILSSLGIEKLSEILLNNKDYLERNGIRPYEIIRELDSRKAKRISKKNGRLEFNV